MRVSALAKRIITEIRHDRRTLALMMIAPMVILTLIYFILDNTTPEVSMAVINAPAKFVESLENNNVTVIRTSEGEARRLVEQGKATAAVDRVEGKSRILLDGSNPNKSRVALASLEAARQSESAKPSRPDLVSEITYVYGYEDVTNFDNMGAALIGIMVFFLVFIVSGMSFLKERTAGTLDKLLSMPIQRWEIVAGYALGFGILTVFQSVLVTLYVIYVLGIMLAGSLLLVLLVVLLTALVSLTLGILMSTGARSEFQMMQFIPIIILPQVFFCGLFELTPVWAAFGRVMPLYYVADALKSVMIKGAGFAEIAPDILVLIAFSMIFMIANTLLLKKHRRI